MIKLESSGKMQKWVISLKCLKVKLMWQGV
jgi:hypothetical protein